MKMGTKKRIFTDQYLKFIYIVALVNVNYSYGVVYS